MNACSEGSSSFLPDTGLHSRLWRSGWKSPLARALEAQGRTGEERRERVVESDKEASDLRHLYCEEVPQGAGQHYSGVLREPPGDPRVQSDDNRHWNRLKYNASRPRDSDVYRDAQHARATGRPDMHWLRASDLAGLISPAMRLARPGIVWSRQEDESRCPTAQSLHNRTRACSSPVNTRGYGGREEDAPDARVRFSDDQRPYPNGGEGTQNSEHACAPVCVCLKCS
jgi:hypothetical protein